MRIKLFSFKVPEISFSDSIQFSAFLSTSSKQKLCTRFKVQLSKKEFSTTVLKHRRGEFEKKNCENNKKIYRKFFRIATTKLTEKARIENSICPSTFLKHFLKKPIKKLITDFS